MFERAVMSLQLQSTKVNELVIVHPNEEGLKNKIDNFDFSGLTVNVVENNGDFDFCTQVNLGVKNAKSKWVSILGV